MKKITDIFLSPIKFFNIPTSQWCLYYRVSQRTGDAFCSLCHFLTNDLWWLLLYSFYFWYHMLRNEYSYFSDNQIEPKLWVKQFKKAIFEIHKLITLFFKLATEQTKDTLRQLKCTEQKVKILFVCFYCRTIILNFIS